MGLIPALQVFSPGGVISSASINANFAQIRDALNAAGMFTDVARTVTVPITFNAPVTASSLIVPGNVNVGGTVVAAGLLRGFQVETIATLPNDVLSQVANFTGGADGVLGPLGLGVRLFPSAAGGSRFAQIIVGDTIGLRTAHFRAQRVFLGTNTAPAFTAGEMLSVEGVVRLQSGAGALQLGAGPNDHVIVEYYPRTASPTSRGAFSGFASAAATQFRIINEIGDLLLSTPTASLSFAGASIVADRPVTAPSFIGSGASLTNIAKANVVGLNTDLSNLVADNVAQNASIATAQSTANTGVANAATAQGTANTALANAATAQGTANSALSGLSGKANTSHDHDAAAVVSGRLAAARLPTFNLDAAGTAGTVQRPNAGFAAYNTKYIDIGGGVFILAFEGTGI